MGSLQRRLVCDIAHLVYAYVHINILSHALLLRTKEFQVLLSIRYNPLVLEYEIHFFDLFSQIQES